MALRRLWLGSAAALALGLAACDGVAFPGFDEQPQTPPQEAPPETPPTSPPVEPPPSPPPAPDPVADDPAPVDPPAETDTTPDPADDTPPAEPTDQPVDDPVDETPALTDPADPADPPTDATDTPEEPPTSGETGSDEGEVPTPEIDPEPLPPPPPPPAPDVEPAFSYYAPGYLTDGSGLGSPDETVYAPDMVFPIKEAPAFPQSMVFRPGGFRYDGDLPGDECIPENYEYPWRDNFCERGRPASFKSASCPAGSGIHLGQDIRVGDAATCNAMRRTYRTNTQAITNYKVVAAEEGMITNISSYTVTLRAGPRTYRYLHMNMRALQVSVGDAVSAGQLLGYVSKDFGFKANGDRRPTTFHLHFVLKVNNGNGSVFVPPYTSLVASYARREGAPGERIDRPVEIAFDTPTWDPDEVFDEIE